MAVLRFSRRAEADLLDIGIYTLRTWGKEQTIRYIDDLEVCCQMLAEHPELSRTCDLIRPGLRRMERGGTPYSIGRNPGFPYSPSEHAAGKTCAR